jgi:hypothetical protein
MSVNRNRLAERMSSRVRALDGRLLDVRKPTQWLLLALTLATMIRAGIPNVPRQYIDYSRTRVLKHVQQHDTLGTDTISDMYVAKVILNDPGDMYTKERLAQTPLEAATWTKEESAPYPPVVLLTETALFALGAWTGLEFYGMILMLACVFVLLSAWYFLRTRWYVFPVLYLNFSYLATRFVYVQDDTYIIMLVVIIVALVLARYRNEACHALMAVAITMKFSPLYYAKHVLSMKRRMAILFVVILVAGLVLPYFIWDNYLYIYGFHNSLKGNVYDTVGAAILAAPFTMLLWYVETKINFDMEDRIGWSVVPFAMFLAIKMRVTRHLFIPLLVPDKRGMRNIAAAVGMGLHDVFPSFILLGSVVYITTALLYVALGYYVTQIGWDTVRDDFQHPGRTLKMMLASARAASAG